MSSLRTISTNLRAAPRTPDIHDSLFPCRFQTRFSAHLTDSRKRPLPARAVITDDRGRHFCIAAALLHAQNRVDDVIATANGLSALQHHELNWTALYHHVQRCYPPPFAHLINHPMNGGSIQISGSDPESEVRHPESHLLHPESYRASWNYRVLRISW